MFFFLAFIVQDDVITRGCKNLEETTPMLRLKKFLFCNYDITVRPSHHKVVTNVTLKLMPQMMEFVSASLDCTTCKVNSYVLSASL